MSLFGKKLFRGKKASGEYAAVNDAGIAAEHADSAAESADDMPVREENTASHAEDTAEQADNTAESADNMPVREENTARRAEDTAEHAESDAEAADSASEQTQGTAAPKQKRNMADFIVDNRKIIAIVVIIAAVVCLFMSQFVKVNYDLTTYLPDYAPSKIAIDKMEETFGYPGTARLMLKDVTLYEAKDYKDKLEAVEGVDQIVWCDMTTSVYQADDFINYDDIDDYYKDNCAVMDVTFTEGDSSSLTHAAIDEMEDIIGDRGYLVGMSPTNKFTEENVEKEMNIILSIAVVMIFVILLLTTTSYAEPVLFLIVMGAAIVLNKGTDLAVGTISYITNNISSVIQLATSMDYSIFLLNAYEREREKGIDKEPAMKAGLMLTIRTVLSSSLTTVFGFIVLVLMDFKMGFDLGIVMAKGIVCSLMMVIFFMPAVLLLMSDLIDKTRHRSLLPSFHGFAKVVHRISPFVLAAVIVLAVPMYFAQNMNDFMYGPDATGTGEKTAIYHQTQEINDKFGRSNLLVCIFPSEGDVKERQLTDELEDKDYVKKVMGMTAYLPEGGYEDLLPSDITELFHKDGYTRLLIYIKTKPESKAAYQYYEEVRDIVESYYGADNTYIAGNTPTTEDMEEILKVDYAKTNNLAMISIFIVVAVAFKSLIIPIGAMIPIMAAIYLNMTFPYLIGTDLIFVAYAVVSCVQLGSTIDYAILTIENYRQIRETEPDKDRAIVRMIEMSFPSMLTSGGILIFCGYIIYLVSTSPATGEVGHLVGRGAIFSVIFVTTLMPTILKIMDRHIVMDHKQRAADRARQREEKRRAKLGIAAENEGSEDVSDTEAVKYPDNAVNAEKNEAHDSTGNMQTADNADIRHMGTDNEISAQHDETAGTHFDDNDKDDRSEEA